MVVYFRMKQALSVEIMGSDSNQPKKMYRFEGLNPVPVERPEDIELMRMKDSVVECNVEGTPIVKGTLAVGDVASVAGRCISYQKFGVPSSVVQSEEPIMIKQLESLESKVTPSVVEVVVEDNKAVVEDKKEKVKLGRKSNKEFHVGGSYLCRYCRKPFKSRAGRVLHERKCPKNEVVSASLQPMDA